MGLAASQARLLMLTARIHDVEYQAQMIQSAKLQLALQEDEVYRKYNEALDATTLTFTNDQGTLVPASFNNLCGPTSIDNGLNKNYVFRTGDNDRLIVPSDVYNGYQEFGGDDPYDFAMFMLGVDVDNDSYQNSIDKFAQDSSDAEYFKTITNSIDEYVDKLAKKSLAISSIDEKEAESIKKSKQELKEAILSDNIAALRDFFDNETYESLEKDFETLRNKCNEYKYKLFKKGAAEIYSGNTNNDKEDFNQKLFDYYLRWGTLIKEEVGLDNCISDKFYSESFGGDSELLNQMLQSGKIIVDVVGFDRKGNFSDEATSVATESSLNYTNTSTIDKKALAKAEAEYEHDMKKIDKKDKQYDMELNKLETERTALTTEYDSVKKVIDDNIKRTFGIFS